MCIDCAFDVRHTTCYYEPNEDLVLDNDKQIFIKDITGLLGGKHSRKLSRVVIVDDKPSHFANYLSNVIPIKPFRGGKDDNQLPALLELLKMVVQEADVRVPLKREIDCKLVDREGGGEGGAGGGRRRRRRRRRGRRWGRRRRR
jgi:NLI interacting factor-like phosphatase